MKTRKKGKEVIKPIGPGEALDSSGIWDIF